jgi:hypothetical protein
LMSYKIACRAGKQQQMAELDHIEVCKYVLQAAHIILYIYIYPHTHTIAYPQTNKKQKLVHTFFFFLGVYSK